MRKPWAVLALVGAPAMVPVFRAEAGGNGAVKANLYIAEWQGDSSVIVDDPPVDVGDVIAVTTDTAKLNVLVKVHGGAPNAEWTVRIIGSGLSSPDELLQTNGKGNGSLQFGQAIPPSAPDPLSFRVVVRDGDRGSSEHVYDSDGPLTVHRK